MGVHEGFLGKAWDEDLHAWMLVGLLVKGDSEKQTSITQARRLPLLVYTGYFIATSTSAHEEPVTFLTMSQF